MNNKLPIKGIVLFIPKLLISWVVVHLMAVLGVFLAVAYPFWWFFFTENSVCLLCKAGIDGYKCPFCRTIINKRKGVSPKNLTSAVLNGLLILVFSVVSVGVVLGEGKILNKLGFPPVPKTVSFLIPAKGQHLLGEIFPMKIEISGVKTPINTVQADISYDPQILEVVEVSTKESFASIFVQKLIDNNSGYVRLSGGLPNPGFFATQGIFGTIFFRGRKPGVAEIHYLPTSMVLANDGRGTNVLKNLSTISYLILPEREKENEVTMNKTLTLDADVLGASVDNTQMNFFEDTQVLGDNTEKNTVVSEKRKVDVFFEKLEILDRLIIEGWNKIIR